MRGVLSKRAARKSILATFAKAQTRHLPLLAEIAYVSVNELSMPGRSHDCISAFIESLRSSKHRVSVSRPLLPPRTAPSGAMRPQGSPLAQGSRKTFLLRRKLESPVPSSSLAPGSALRAVTANGARHRAEPGKRRRSQMGNRVNLPQIR